MNTEFKIEIEFQTLVMFNIRDNGGYLTQNSIILPKRFVYYLSNGYFEDNSILAVIDGILNLKYQFSYEYKI